MAERQWKIFVQQRRYYLDFAVFCNAGKLAIETDGYSFHYDSKNQIDYDTWRQNQIVLDDWYLLRYTTDQIKDDSAPYITQIQQKIDQLGGPEPPKDFKRKIGEEQAQYIVDGEEPL